jgi:hypothetical protein
VGVPVLVLGFQGHGAGDAGLSGLELVRMREPQFVELSNAISDDVAWRIDLAELHDRYVR